MIGNFSKAGKKLKTTICLITSNRFAIKLVIVFLAYGCTSTKDKLQMNNNGDDSKCGDMNLFRFENVGITSKYSMNKPEIKSTQAETQEEEKQEDLNLGVINPLNQELGKDEFHHKLHEEIDRCMRKLNAYDVLKNAVLFLGPTGSGKSTTINFLKKNKLFKKKKFEDLDSDDEDEDDYVIDLDPELNNNNNNPEIGHTNISCTFYPSPYEDIDANITYCDCPGFCDNRGEVAKIATTISNNVMLRQADSVKSIVIVTEYASFKSGRGKVFLDGTISTINEMFVKTDYEKDDDEDPVKSMVFLFTKVKSKTSKKTIIRRISNFREDFNEKINENPQFLQYVKILDRILYNKQNIQVVKPLEEKNRDEVINILTSCGGIDKNKFKFLGGDSVKEYAQRVVVDIITRLLGCLRDLKRFSCEIQLLQKEVLLVYKGLLHGIEGIKTQLHKRKAAVDNYSEMSNRLAKEAKSKQNEASSTVNEEKQAAELSKKNINETIYDQDIKIFYSEKNNIEEKLLFFEKQKQDTKKSKSEFFDTISLYDRDIKKTQQGISDKEKRLLELEDDISLLQEKKQELKMDEEIVTRGMSRGWAGGFVFTKSYDDVYRHPYRINSFKYYSNGGTIKNTRRVSENKVGCSFIGSRAGKGYLYLTIVHLNGDVSDIKGMFDNIVSKITDFKQQNSNLKAALLADKKALENIRNRRKRYKSKKSNDNMSFYDEEITKIDQNIRKLKFMLTNDFNDDKKPKVKNVELSAEEIDIFTKRIKSKKEEIRREKTRHMQDINLGLENLLVSIDANIENVRKIFMENYDRLGVLKLYVDRLQMQIVNSNCTMYKMTSATQTAKVIYDNLNLTSISDLYEEYQQLLKLYKNKEFTYKVLKKNIINNIQLKENYKHCRNKEFDKIV